MARFARYPDGQRAACGSRSRSEAIPSATSATCRSAAPTARARVGDGRGLPARAGYRIGLFTSPHLHRFVERVAIDGRPLAQGEAARRIASCSRRSSARCARHDVLRADDALAIEAFRDHALRRRGARGRARRPARCHECGHAAVLGDHAHGARPHAHPGRHGDRDRAREGRHHQAFGSRSSPACAIRLRCA